MMVNRFKDSGEIPANRVVRADGSIKFQKGSVDFKRQKKRLEAEGVEVDAKGFVDLKMFGLYRISTSFLCARSNECSSRDECSFVAETSVQEVLC